MITDTAAGASAASPDMSVRGRRRLAAVGVIALLGLAACTSDPSAKKVASDIIEAQALAAEEAGEDFPEQCMLDALDTFTNEELEEIANDLSNTNADTRAEAQVALDAFEAALAACN